MNNADLRKALKSQRSLLSFTYQFHAARQASQTILNKTWFNSSKKIAFYLPHRGELNPALLLKSALAAGKNCFLPVLHPLKHDQLCFVAYHSGDALKKNQFGIWEPNLGNTPLISAWELDLVFAPLVAFDKHGHRLGMGKGYYDRTFAFILNDLSKPKPILVGLAYEFQKVELLRNESWDVPLDYIVTEQNCYKAL